MHQHAPRVGQVRDLNPPAGRGHGVQHVGEQRDLGLSELPAPLGVGHREVAEEAAQAQARGVRTTGQVGRSLGWAADAAHAGVHLQVHGRRAPQPGGHPADLVDGLRGHDGEVDFALDARRDLVVTQRVTELEDGQPHAGIADRDRLVDGRDAEPVGRAGRLEHARHWHGPMAVGVGLDRGQHEPPADPRADGVEVGADVVQARGGRGRVQHGDHSGPLAVSSPCRARPSR